MFGVADYAASLQSHTTSIGGPTRLRDADRPQGRRPRAPLGDQWHYALSRIAVVCRAYGLRPIDGPFGDFTDPEGYIASAAAPRCSATRASGRSIPSQIALANEVFTPHEHLVENTHRIIAAMEEAAARARARSRSTAG